MPRRLKLKTHEVNDLELFLIYQYGDKYEPAWLALQGDPITTLFTAVSLETMTHALAGWTRPLVRGLGIPPEGALRKLSTSNRVCERRDPCPFYRPKDCIPTAKAMPWCFEPAGIEDLEARILAAEAVNLWRAQVYIVVVIDGK